MKHDEFRVTEQHLLLLRQMNVSWWAAEFGAPAIDPKRPYGNSDVYGDMARILGLAPGDDSDYDVFTNRLHWLHRETQTALQIALAVGEFRAGLYRAPCYTAQWQRVGD